MSDETPAYESDAPAEGTVDAVVIGGGAAGLNGALVLARSRRSVVVIDSGSPRNVPAEAVHGTASSRSARGCRSAPRAWKA